MGSKLVGSIFFHLPTTVKPVFKGHCDEGTTCDQGTLSQNGVHFLRTVSYLPHVKEPTMKGHLSSRILRCPLKTGFTVLILANFLISPNKYSPIMYSFTVSEHT